MTWPPVDLPPSRWTFDPSGWPQDDCVAHGADLEPATVIDAYRHGAFPMPHGRRMLWWSPLERGVLGPGDLRVTRSLRKSARKYQVRFDTRFADVIAACADPRRPGAWIDRRIARAYLRLHELGWAHSVEVFAADELVGGLYGLSIGALFAGESMFHRATDASKVALWVLCEHLAEQCNGHWLIDTQWQTEHLATLGVRVVDRVDYVAQIADLVDSAAILWQTRPPEVGITGGLP